MKHKPIYAFDERDYLVEVQNEMDKHKRRNNKGR